MAYSGIFTHYWDVWSYNQTYSELWVTLAYTTVPCSESWFIYNPRHLQKPMEHVGWSCIFRALAQSEQFIQAFSRILRLIQRYWCILSHTHKRATRGKRGSFPCLFKNHKKCLISERKASIVSIFGLNFPFKM